MFARIEDGAIVDRRSEPTETGDWRPIVIEGRRTYDAEVYNETCVITLEPTRVVVKYALAERALADVKNELLSRVTQDAERERAKVLTLASGKVMSYNEKVVEARLVLSDVSNPPSTDVVPILSRESVARKLSLVDMATLVMDRYTACKAAEVSINETEVTANLAINAASSISEARSAYDSVVWPSVG